MIVNTAIKQTQKRLSAMEEDVYKNDQMENIVKQLEKDNKELQNKLKTSPKQKFEELEGELKNEDHKDSSKNKKRFKEKKRGLFKL